MDAATKRQDMPPPGGYKKFIYARVPQKTYLSGFQMLGGVGLLSAVGCFVYYLTYKKTMMQDIELRSARNVMLPILLAERDREYLRQLRRNRDEEADLMKNVPGWEVGTWYGEPIYKTLPQDKLLEPSFREFYVHADNKSTTNRANIKLWT